MIDQLTPVYSWLSSHPPVALTAAVGILFMLFGGKRRSKSKRASLHRHHIKQSKAALQHINSQNSWPETLGYLRRIHHTTFEELILTALSEAGIQIQRNKRYTGDGGIDGVAYLPNGKKLIIQAKRYTSHVSTQHVQQFVELCRLRNSMGIFVHTGKTPKNAWTHTSPKGVAIISGPRLVAFLKNPQTELRNLFV
ncbi:restriction endonuclease [Aeromonas sp. Y311-2]|uniref:restriction endonuclease n=1 Tax=Aeromonas sp. Y311-2 TaxID=2990507 RepID=UPI0022E8AF1B|nr:restriction endonuclease [Aeromonas sp. Y311-2]